ncbi:hypothetical protein SPD48_01340 [Pseudogracilibacillus sp. SE30717A]|uniref:hypothetical protein n=1 Tax=Pseudogracilibacillus sp. SE30717A TaxID=3098293 RepID=UPI00300E6705
MSEYKIFLQERDQIDFLIQKGYKITKVTENLNGAYIEFENNEQEDKEVLHIITPEGRKYFSVLLISQQQGA